MHNKKRTLAFDELLTHLKMECLPFIESAFYHRINDGEKLSYLSHKEEEKEKEAYENFFNIELSSLKNIEQALEIINKKASYICDTIKKELKLKNKNKENSNEYFNYFIETNNNDIVQNINICTDAHSSKELLIEKKFLKIFCGDISGRQLPLNYHSQLNDNFYIIKHFFFILCQLIKAAETYRDLFCNKKKLGDLKELATLGNHDLIDFIYYDAIDTIFSEKDRKHNKKKITEIAEKIHNIIIQIIPTEIIIQNNHNLFIFSHSGGTYIYPEKIITKKKEHIDFSITKHTYNLKKSFDFVSNSNYSQEIKNKYIDIISAEMIKYYDSNKNYFSLHPTLWCDLFTQNEKQENNGRIKLLDIKNYQTLEYITEIIFEKYKNEIKKKITKTYIVRGHEHSSIKFNLFINETGLQKNFYRYEIKNKNIILIHLPPHAKDNLYFLALKKKNIDPLTIKYASIKEIITESIYKIIFKYY